MTAPAHVAREPGSLRPRGDPRGRGSSATPRSRPAWLAPCFDLRAKSLELLLGKEPCRALAFLLGALALGLGRNEQLSLRSLTQASASVLAGLLEANHVRDRAAPLRAARFAFGPVAEPPALYESPRR